MMRKAWVAAGVFGFSLALWPLAGSAHTHLEKSEPEKNAELTEPPATVRLVFSSRIESDFSKIEVTDASGARVNEDKMTSSDNHREIETSLSTGLKPGVYTVKWNVISDDGHRVKGNYQFTVK